jgi:hypothetical protein
MEMLEFGGGGGSSGPRYYFAVLLDAYCGKDTAIGQSVIAALEIFDGNLDDKVKIHIPHKGAESRFLGRVLGKKWTNEQRHDLGYVPSVLFMEKSLDEFDPQTDRYLHIRADPYISASGSFNDVQFSRFLKTMEKWIKSDLNIIRQIEDYHRDEARKDFLTSFEMKPGIFGCSVDAKKLLSYLKKDVFK